MTSTDLRPGMLVVLPDGRTAGIQAINYKKLTAKVRIAPLKKMFWFDISDLRRV